MRTCNKKICAGIAFVAMLLLSLCAVLLTLPGAAAEVGDGKYHTVTVVPNNSTYGTVTVTGDYQNPDNPNEYKESVKLKAIPNKGYQFVRWEGNTTAEQAELEVQLSSDDATYSYTAVFEPKTYRITYTDEGYQIVQFDQEYQNRHTYGKTTQLVEPISIEGRFRFIAWDAYVSENGNLVKKASYYPDPTGFEIGAAEYDSDIIMVAQYEFADCDVTCIDRAPDGTELGRTVFRLKWGTQNVTGTSEGIGAVTHRGYYYNESCYALDKTLNKVTDDPNNNIVERYYKAKTYRIEYDFGFATESVEGMPAQHVYDLREDVAHATRIPVPPREGWTFTGWTIVNRNEANFTYTVIGENGAAESKLYPQSLPLIGDSYYLHGYAYDSTEWTPETADSFVIRLQANWVPNEYKVNYENITKVNEGLQYLRPYNEDFVLGAITREGYTFLGWTLAVPEGEEAGTPQLTYTVPASSTVEVLTFVAHWQANSYTVTLNPDVDDPAEIVAAGDAAVTVVFDQPLPDIVPPTRKGHIFRGYFTGSNGTATQYYDENGHCMADVTWTVAGDTVLYALWEVDSFEVSVNADLLNVADVYFRPAVEGAERIPYLGTPLSFDYGTRLEVLVVFRNGCKMVKWQGGAVEHAAVYNAPVFTVEANTVLTGEYAAANPVPELTVDYLNEIFTSAEGKIPAGEYLLRCLDEELRFSVDENGLITVGNSPKTGFLSASGYFGRKVEIVRCGNGTDTADSDPQKLTLATRPEAPVRNTHLKEVNGLDGYIVIKLMDGQIEELYEYACSPVRVPDRTTGLVWQSTPRFDDLKAGTPYYIYIRVAATQTAPHGEACEEETATLSGKYLQEQIKKLEALAGAEDGENVQKLIAAGVAEMNALQPTSNYVEKLDEILKTAAAGMQLARAQDAAIAKLRSLCCELEETAAYSDVGIAALQSALEGKVNAINSATAAEEIESLTEAGERELYAVRINYLYQGEDVLLSHEAGMDYGYRVVLSRDPAIAAIAAHVQHAIQAGTVKLGAGNTGLTLDEAVKALQSLDTAAYYHFQLLYRGSTASVPKGPFVGRILLPSDLRNVTGMQVAYYNSGTEELVLLKTWVEKDSDEGSNRMYLYFETDSIQDFVILGDRNVSLTGAIITLGTIVFFQLVAILFLAIQRKKSSGDANGTKATAHGLALPLFALTVRYFPAYSMQLTVALGALAVILQIVLIWLLITTDVIHHRGRKENPNPQKIRHPRKPDSADTEETEVYDDVPTLSEWHMDETDDSNPGFEDMPGAEFNGESYLPDAESDEEPYMPDLESYEDFDGTSDGTSDQTDADTQTAWEPADGEELPYDSESSGW